MKRLVALALAALMSASLAATAIAAPAGAPPKAKQQQGLKNAKKVMKAKLERDKKMQELRKKAYAKREQALGRK